MPSDDQSSPPFNSADFKETFLVDGQKWPIYGYRFDADHQTWPEAGGIYAISKDYDGEVRRLVGRTGEFRKRWMQHRTRAKNRRHENQYFQASFNKHQGQGFVFWIIESNIPLEKQGQREAFWYYFLNSDKNLNGWNIVVPSEDGSWRLAEETKEKLRQINLGKNHTPETCVKMSRSHSGEKNCNWGKKGPLNPLYLRKLSPERCEQIRQMLLSPNNPLRGKKHSDEHKAKIAQGSLVKIPIKLISPSGQTITFQSVRIAAKQTGIKPGRLHHFIKKMKVGDVLDGWTLASEYTGTKLNQKTKAFNERIKAPNGEILHVTSLTSFANTHGFNRRHLYHFMKNAKIGALFHGFEKIQEYRGEYYV